MSVRHVRATTSEYLTPVLSTEARNDNREPRPNEAISRRRSDNSAAYWSPSSMWSMCPGPPVGSVGMSQHAGVRFGGT